MGDSITVGSYIKINSVVTLPLQVDINNESLLDCIQLTCLRTNENKTTFQVKVHLLFLSTIDYSVGCPHFPLRLATVASFFFFVQP